MKLVRLPLSWLFLALQLLIPPKRNQIAYISFPDFADNAFYMFVYLLRNQPDLSHVWLIQDEAARARIERVFQTELSQPGVTLQILQRNSLRGYWAYLKSKTLFHTHGTYFFQRHIVFRTVVCLWHGMPIKCIGRLNRISPNPFPPIASLHVASSHFFKYPLAHAFDCRPADVLVSGLPRCDVLKGYLSPVMDLDQIKGELGIERERKIVLWMPTYRSEGKISEATAIRSFMDDLPADTLPRLSALCDELPIQLVIKLHPLEKFDPSQVSWNRGIKVLTSAEFEALGIPLYDLIAAADALISDVSSVLIDFLLSAKPAAVLGFDEETYTRETVFPPELLFNCDKLARLETLPDIERFLRQLGAVSKSDAADCAGIFNEDARLYSCQRIASSIGLEMN